MTFVKCTLITSLDYNDVNLTLLEVTGTVIGTGFPSLATH